MKIENKFQRSFLIWVLIIGHFTYLKLPLMDHVSNLCVLVNK